MVRALQLSGKKAGIAATFIALFGLPAFAQQDPPSRVARLNHTEGNVSMQPAGFDEWAPAIINRPFTIGDYLYTDGGARAELHIDNAVLRMGPQTSFGFLNLNDQAVQIKLSEGDMSFRLHRFGSDQVFEVDTPNAAVTLLRDGVYRFRIDPNGNMSFVVVREGQAEITGGGQAFTLNPGQSALISSNGVSGTDQVGLDVEGAPAPDDFDSWCARRDAHEAHLASARYLPPTVIGYEDLDDYGAWQEAGDYGPVWYPRTVAAGWAPYQAGHWAWVEPWGWTWVDDAPWGFAPFHYGRWAYISGRWGWCPGPIAVGYQGPVARPYYAPALVAWFGGAHWGVSVSAARPSLGWVALGFGEVFTPPYVCSRRYFTNVNVYNTRVVQTVNITNVYNTVYVNHTVYNREYVNVRAPGAVMTMDQDAFSRGRSVREGGAAMRQADLGRLQGGAVIAPSVAPTRQSFTSNISSSTGRPVARPPAQVFARQVVARNTPPAAPAAFAARQQFLAQHAGQPFDAQAMHQAVGIRGAPVALVRQAPAASAPVQVRAGQRIGNVGPVSGGPGTPGRFTERTAPAQPRSAERSVPQATERSLPQASEQSRPAQRPQDSRPALTERTQPDPSSQRPTPDPHFAERSQSTPTERSQARATEKSQPGRPADSQPAITERTQPDRTERPARPGNGQPAAAERSQPDQRQPGQRQPDRSQHPTSDPRSAERSQPVQQEARPVAHPQPAAPPPVQHQAAPAASEHRPSGAEHEDHHSTAAHKDEHKDTSK